MRVRLGASRFTRTKFIPITLAYWDLQSVASLATRNGQMDRKYLRFRRLLLLLLPASAAADTRHERNVEDYGGDGDDDVYSIYDIISPCLRAVHCSALMHRSSARLLG